MNFGNSPRKGSFMGGKANPGTGLEGRQAGSGSVPKLGTETDPS